VIVLVPDKLYCTVKELEPVEVTATILCKASAVPRVNAELVVTVVETEASNPLSIDKFELAVTALDTVDSINL
jgi:hypothetical protein